jgi:hypothetical protein
MNTQAAVAIMDGRHKGGHDDGMKKGERAP